MKDWVGLVIVCILFVLWGTPWEDFKLMVDANHAYNFNDALYVGRGLDELDVFWFEEPVAPEDYEGYRELKRKIKPSYN